MINLIEKSLAKRYKKERNFKIFGVAAIFFAISFLLIFLSVIFVKGNKAFIANKIELEIDFSRQNILQKSELLNDFSGLEETEILEKIGYRELIRESLRKKFMQSRSKEELSEIYGLVSENSVFGLRDILENNFNYVGQNKKVWLNVSSEVDVYLKYDIAESFNLREKTRIDVLVNSGIIKSFFNWQFFTATDSREPESAGIAASLVGSFLVMAVFLIFAFPIGVMCAFYLEEFAPKNKFTDLIEISINNLAAIPSIIYGLLGLTLYLQIMNLPRSSALVGGMTLFMLVLPVIIIATRNTIRTIPQQIRDAAVGLGASKMQVALHHILPLSIPGIMTGTILAMSRALGETAPLLMIGMVAFIADIPSNFFEPTTVLPVQIFLWSDSPEIGFAEKTSAAIIILLGFLIIFNLVAIILRKKFERKW